jgi:hypothetical protein
MYRPSPLLCDAFTLCVYNLQQKDSSMPSIQTDIFSQLHARSKWGTKRVNECPPNVEQLLCSGIRMLCLGHAQKVFLGQINFKICLSKPPLPLWYCPISINLSPLCDCDAPDEIFILSPCQEGCDKVQISSDGAKFGKNYPFVKQPCDVWPWPNFVSSDGSVTRDRQIVRNWTVLALTT